MLHAGWRLGQVHADAHLATRVFCPIECVVLEMEPLKPELSLTPAVCVCVTVLVLSVRYSRTEQPMPKRKSGNVGW